MRLTATATLPQASVTFHVLVCERLHPCEVTLPSAKVGVTAPQLSVAVAVPKAAFIVAALGLHPKAPFVGVPVAVITGTVVSSVQVKVFKQVDERRLPGAGSVAVYVNICVRLQPLMVIVPGEQVTGTGPLQLRAVKVPQLGGVGLQPSAVEPSVQLSNTGG